MELHSDNINRKPAVHDSLWELKFTFDEDLLISTELVYSISQCGV
jgi:hypothetical protein